ncbi:hypothetical protein [Yinghuangia sp. YIM S09857]|uniref:hypothetical protein n=1 Tax=Yinghuangia sp. YIM S09857 TaxID=3436929 RepID=UPI003F52E6C8
MIKRSLAAAASAAALASVVVTVPPAHAEGAGKCNPDRGEACLFYNSGQGGAYYGTNKTTAYTSTMRFGGGGNGNGVPVKNNAASVINFSFDHFLVIDYNSSNRCAYACQKITPHRSTNLNSTLKNNNAAQHWLRSD